MKKENEIEILRNLYFEGKTTVEQEKRLRELSVKSPSDKTAHEDIRMISAYADEEIKRVSEIYGIRTRRHARNNATKRIVRAAWISAAASIMIIAGISSIMKKQFHNRNEFELIIDGNMIDDRETALKIAEKSLAKFSMASSCISRSRESIDNMNRKTAAAIDNIKSDRK